MPQRSIRFGVRKNESLHSATWKLWTNLSGNRSEIYLACRELGGELKASMHHSGEWHVAFCSNSFEEKVEGAISGLNSRFVEKWPRPPELAEGITLAFRIVTPESAVSSVSKVKKPNKLVWVPAPPEGKAIEIYICITTPKSNFSDWPGKDSMATELLGSIRLNNDDTVWVVSKNIEYPDLSNLSNGAVQLFKGKSKNDIKDAGNLRALIFGRNQDGSRVIYDTSIQAGNT